METIIKKTINDPQYYSPNAIGGKASQLMGYGRHHGKELSFSIRKGTYVEMILCKTPRAVHFKTISFCWLIGGYDEHGNRKIGVSFLYDSNGCEFSLYLEEVVELLTELGSEQELQGWRDQLDKKQLAK